MIKIKNNADCCGCTACASVCAHDAIEMKPDALGFLYPVVDADKCINCGLCDKVCAFNDDYDTSLNLEVPLVYGARHKDINQIERSRSGAAFVAISDWILSEGGVVYGAGYEDHFRVVHKRATTKDERDEYRGSKYVQSDLQGVFRQVKTDLKNGLIVLFTGTPCQTAGLNSYIGKKLRERLYLVDIICHGVPSPFVWRDYLAYLEKKEGSKIVWVNFRDKQQFGWRDHRESFIFSRGGVKMFFTKVFYQNVMFRHSCGNCHYCNTKRPSDLTLGDFWGWEKTNPDANIDDKGISLVLINTEKGKQLWANAKKDMDSFPSTIEDCMQERMAMPTPISPNRMKFERDYVKHGFEYIYNHDYSKIPLIRRIINRVKRIITKHEN